jgi:hypothetical protein
VNVEVPIIVCKKCTTKENLHENMLIQHKNGNIRKNSIYVLIDAHVVKCQNVISQHDRYPAAQQNALSTINN